MVLVWSGTRFREQQFLISLFNYKPSTFGLLKNLAHTDRDQYVAPACPVGIAEESVILSKAVSQPEGFAFAHPKLLSLALQMAESDKGWYTMVYTPSAWSV